MKTLTMLGCAVALVAALVASPVAAAETTLSGSLACAKCTLKKADATQCQDVLTVKDANGAATEYYIVKNESLEKAGHQCSKAVNATVTGTVSEKDGKKWITASKIEKQS